MINIFLTTRFTTKLILISNIGLATNPFSSLCTYTLLGQAGEVETIRIVKKIRNRRPGYYLKIAAQNFFERFQENIRGVPLF